MKILELIKSKLTSEGVSFDDEEKSIQCLSNCVASKKLIEIYLKHKLELV